MRGKVARILTSFGFITPEDSEGNAKDLFFHKSGTSNFYELSVGDVVEYEETVGKKGDTIATIVEKVEK